LKVKGVGMISPVSNYRDKDASLADRHRVRGAGLTAAGERGVRRMVGLGVMDRRRWRLA
jgi:microsomal dipeptidase-like Zn-dependent dipeptidase